MFRLKSMSILAGMIAVLCVSAAPAAAWWEANSSATKEATGEGKAVVIKSGEFVDQKIPVICPAEGVTVTWSIQTKGQIKQHQVEEKQLKTKFGPHLNLAFKWGTGCTSEILGEKVKATVSDCELQLVQQKGSLVATGGVVTLCVVKAGPCVIQVPAGMEKQAGSNEGVNVGLKETKLVNKENIQLDEVSVGGIQALRGSGSLSTCPLSNNETAELKGAVIEVIGAKAV
jgi:hypothetical protein